MKSAIPVLIFFLLLPSCVLGKTDHDGFVVTLALAENVRVIKEVFVRFEVAKIDTIEVLVRKFDENGNLSSKYLKDHFGNIRFFKQFARAVSGEVLKINHNNSYTKYYDIQKDTVRINKITPRGDTLEKCVEFDFEEKRDSIFVRRCVARFGDVDSIVEHYNLASGKKIKSLIFFNSNLRTRERFSYDERGNVARVITEHYTAKDNRQSFLQSRISSRRVVETRTYSADGKLTRIVLNEAGETNKILYEYNREGYLTKILYLKKGKPEMTKIFHYSNINGKTLVSRVTLLNRDGINIGDYFYTYKFDE